MKRNGKYMSNVSINLMNEFSYLKELAPTVGIALVLGYFHFRAIKIVSESNGKVIDQLGVAHQEKTVAFLEEAKKKDQTIYDLVTNHLARSNEVMEKLSMSHDRLSMVIDNALKTLK
jgi:hypothetical protein